MCVCVCVCVCMCVGMCVGMCVCACIMCVVCDNTEIISIQRFFCNVYTNKKIGQYSYICIYFFPKSDNSSFNSWQVYSRANTDMLVQVWRRPDATEKNKFTLIGSHMIHLREHRVNTVTVPRFEQIEVQKDDLIGWYYPDGAVGLEYDACASDYSAYGYYQTEIDRIDKFYAGMSMTSGNSGACRMYSIAAVLAPGETENCACENSHADIIHTYINTYIPTHISYI